MNRTFDQRGNLKKNKYNETYAERQLKFPGYIMGKDGMENLSLTSHIRGKT